MALNMAEKMQKKHCTFSMLRDPDGKNSEMSTHFKSLAVNNECQIEVKHRT